jgi:phosphinothricin acetyltransferase
MDKAMPVVVVETDQVIVGFSACFPYRPRPCYQGVAEFCTYVLDEWRGRGVGRLALERLLGEAEQAGMWKMVSRVFPENVAAMRLLERIGFRVVGTYQRHARLDDEWRDVLILEYLLSNARNGLTRPE